MIWEQATNHYNGQALENGCDVTIVQKHTKYLRRKGEYRQATLLNTICAGGLWCQKRKYEAGLVESPVCPLCGEGDQDTNHMFWVCSHTCACAAPEVVSTNHLRGRAYDFREVIPCWYNRGIPPRAYTHRAKVGEEVRHTVGVLTDLPVGVLIYLDGSGGKQTSDPRNRTY